MLVRIAAVVALLAIGALNIWSNLSAQLGWSPLGEPLGWLGEMALGSGVVNAVGQPALAATPFQLALALLAGAVVAVLSVMAAWICWRLHERLLAQFLAAAIALCCANAVASLMISFRIIGTQWGRPPVAAPDGTLVYGGELVWPAIIGPLLVLIANVLFLWFWSHRQRVPSIQSS